MTFRESVDWYGRPSVYQPQTAMNLTEDKLIFQFRCRKAPLYDENLKPGDFVEGLWEKDVAEFFVAGPGPGYQEINVSPGGSWWSCLFADYRERVQVVRFQPRIECCREENGWAVTFEAELNDLIPWRGLSAGERRISPTAILYDPEPHYFAWNHTGGGEPDFHLRHLLKPIS